MRLIDADALFNWGKHKLSDAIRYGNKDVKQRDFSYDTLMMYEIADEINDAPGIETDLSLDRIRELVEADRDRDGRCVVLACTKDALLKELERCEEPTIDEEETYTTGYLDGSRNGRAELIRWILMLPSGCAEAEEAQHE